MRCPLALALLVLAFPARAQAPRLPPDTLALPTVSVVATRVEASTAEAPARVTILGPEAIRASGSYSVADLVEARSSAMVQRYGPGGLASLSLRGTGASQTLVLLDGQRIADPQLGQLDLSLIPTVLLDRVDILHGAGSALHGTDGIGGVVDLRTTRPEQPGFRLSATTGAFGESRLSGRVATSAQGLRVMAAAETAREEGDFPYFDPNRGDTGEVRRRTGADGTLASGFVRVEAERGRTAGHLAGWAGQAERGVPGSIGSPTEARQEDRHVRLWGGTTTPFGWGTLRTGGLVQRAALRYRADEGRTWLGSAEAEARVPFRRWLVSAGATLGAGAADHPALASEAREARAGAFLSATGRLGPLRVYPALRADVYARPSGSAQTLAALSPRLGLNWQPSAALPVHLKAGAGSAFRAPTFNDRFWRYADPLARGGDPDLRPERGWTADAGAVASRGGLSAEVTAYGAWLRDRIVWLPSTSGTYAPLNLGRTRTLGLEATAQVEGLRVGPALVGGGVVYALTDARDRSDSLSPLFNRALRYVPRHQVKVHASALVGLGLQTRLRLDVGGRAIAARPVTADGSFAEPPYGVADGQLGLARRFERATATLTLAVENALDARYAVIRGYPMPPRHARLRFQVGF